MTHYLAGSVSLSTPHVNISEPVGVGILVLLLLGYLAWRQGVSIIHSIALLIAGSLLSGLWPALSGKITQIASGGTAEKSTTYIIAFILIGISIFTGERRLRGGGE